MGKSNSPREIRRGEDIAWYADGETILRNEETPSIAYAYGAVGGLGSAWHDRINNSMGFG
ncbi:kinesin motor domain-containing protein [Artemisia annua]|uniref:Kinesin motor domain-containing protein n=1 Tax=Artemisia annua TaxID=35608 RepID=A0A2U1L075_ARTAN|nr:kinesin motor domain-containing protein [Artemisia annua]